jgi:uncharacterized protein YybS (DUF2232 family)
VTDSLGGSSRSVGQYLMAATIPVYVALLFGGRDSELSMAAAVVLAAVTYFVSICVYFFTAWLTRSGQSILLWVSSVLAAGFGFMLVGIEGIWALLTGLSMVLFGGVLVGRLSAAGQAPSRVYLLGTLAVGFFAVAQFWPVWSPLMQAAREASQVALGELEVMLQSVGYNQTTVAEILDRSNLMFGLLIRVIPAFTILGSLVPFTAGYLWYTYRVQRADPTQEGVVPFTTWRVPFVITPVVILAVLARLLGGEAVALVADNLLVILALYYGVSGLSLLEYFLRRLRLSFFVRALFYLLLFFTQLVGLLAMAVLGFIDSFADWRARAEAANAETV